MRSKEKFGVLTFVVLLAMLAFVGCASAKTWYVDDDGGYDFTKIQDAINAASPGDTIFVYNGIYYENVVMSKRLTLQGENRDSTIIDGGGSGDCVRVSADGCEISGFTTRNSGLYRTGIVLSHSDNNILTNNNASNNPQYGIYLDYSSNNTLSNNNASNNYYDGIRLWYSSNNTLMNNTASNNDYRGIYLSSSSNNTLSNNRMSGNNYNFEVSGYSLSHYSQNIDRSNLVDGKPVYYWVNQQDQQVPGDAGYVGVVNSANITVRDLTLTKNGEGVLFAYTTNSTIENVNAANNDYGIHLSYSSNNTLSNNTASNNDYGIHLSYSSNNTLSNNTASNNDYGIHLSYSSNNTLSDNRMSGNNYNFGVHGRSLSHYIQNIDRSNRVDGKPVYYWVNQQDQQVPNDAGYVGVVNSTNITVRDLTLTKNGDGVLFACTTNSWIENVNVSNNDDYGIYLYYSSNNTLSNNTASNNRYGIYLYPSSNNNTLSNNTASNNRYGIWLDYSSSNTLMNNTASNNDYYGIWLDYSSSNMLMNNTASNNDYYGIQLKDSSNNNTLTNNTASNNYYYGNGISLYSSSNNTLTDNTASNNNQYGIYLSASSNNTLTDNTASNNNQYGIYLSASSNNNLIYNNYFNNTNNADDIYGNNIWNITKTKGTNIMGGSCLGGNYWSDYRGEDLNWDDLGDTLLPYNSAGKIRNGGDYLPLVKAKARVKVVLITSNTGEAPGHIFGGSVSAAGDVNKDGFDDVIVGASGAKKAYIYFGGKRMNSTADVTLEGEAGYYFGSAVSSAGDVNRDGCSDVIVGAYSIVGTGRAYIFLGSAAMDTKADMNLSGEDTSFGASVSTAGDVNGDGFDDVIVGASDANKAYVYFGGANMDNTPDVTLNGEAPNDYFGGAVSSAGNVNGDGIEDVIVGARNAGGTGKAYIFFGNANMSMDNTPDVILAGEASGDMFGYSVSSAGDVNGEGYSDVIVGARFNDAGGEDAGRAYIFYGNTHNTSMDSTPDVILTGEAAGDQFGISVSAAGDVNKDKFDDVIVGAHKAGGNGSAYIYIGAPLLFGVPLMDNISDVDLTGEASYTKFGYSVSNAGDVNDNSYMDVIVGAIGDTGKAYVYGVNKPPSVEVVYPNGGEVLNKTITVKANASDADGYVENVTFKYSADNGTTWTSLGNDTTSPYTYDWNTRTVANGSYLLKAIATDNLGYTARDISDATFTIDNPLNEPPYVEVVYPNGGEVLKGLVTLNATAYDTDGTVAKVEFQYSNDSGVNWNSLGDATPSGHYYLFDWFTPEVENGFYLLKAIATDDCGATANDTSDYVFEIKNPVPDVEVVYPDGGEILRGTVTINASASASDGYIINVEFLYSADSGGNWTSLGNDTTKPYAYTWNTTNVADGVRYLIKAIATDNRGKTASDTSNATFTIDNIPECGDVNCDELVDMSDVIGLLYSVGYPGQYTIRSDWAADVNCDGHTDMSDVIDLFYYVGYPGQYELKCC